MTITAEMVAPLLDAVENIVTVALPVGIGIMGIMLGVSFLPKIVKRLAK